MYRFIFHTYILLILNSLLNKMTYLFFLKLSLLILVNTNHSICSLLLPRFLASTQILILEYNIPVQKLLLDLTNGNLYVMLVKVHIYFLFFKERNVNQFYHTNVKCGVKENNEIIVLTTYYINSKRSRLYLILFRQL